MGVFQAYASKRKVRVERRIFKWLSEKNVYRYIQYGVCPLQDRRVPTYILNPQLISRANRELILFIGFDGRKDFQMLSKVLSSGTYNMGLHPAR